MYYLNIKSYIKYKITYNRYKNIVFLYFNILILKT